MISMPGCCAICAATISAVRRRLTELAPVMLESKCRSFMTVSPWFDLVAELVCDTGRNIGPAIPSVQPNNSDPIHRMGRWKQDPESPPEDLPDHPPALRQLL